VHEPQKVPTTTAVPAPGLLGAPSIGSQMSTALYVLGAHKRRELQQQRQQEGAQGLASNLGGVSSTGGPSSSAGSRRPAREGWPGVTPGQLPHVRKKTKGPLTQQVEQVEAASPGGSADLPTEAVADKLVLEAARGIIDMLDTLSAEDFVLAVNGVAASGAAPGSSWVDAAMSATEAALTSGPDLRGRHHLLCMLAWAAARLGARPSAAWRTQLLCSMQVGHMWNLAPECWPADGQHTCCCTTAVWLMAGAGLSDLLQCCCAGGP
jgi:hypothetical protein